METKGEGILSKPKANIKIVEVVHFLKDGEIYTKGKFKVVEIFKDDLEIHFNGFTKV